MRLQSRQHILAEATDLLDKDFRRHGADIHVEQQIIGAHPLGAFDPTEFLDAVEREQATTAFCVPAQWQLICEEPTV